MTYAKTSTGPREILNLKEWHNMLSLLGFTILNIGLINEYDFKFNR